MFLVGFDLARFGFKSEGRSPAPGAAGAMWTALLAAATILGIWTWALALAILSTSLIMLIISDPARGALMQFMLSTAGVCWLGGWLLSWVRL